VEIVNVEITPLPGIGTRQDFMIRSGRRIGVITYRDGKFELIVSKQDDPDSCVASIPLSPEEASTLAGLLGAPQLVAHLTDQHRDITGITTRQLPVTAFANRTLGDTALRTRTGVSIVAVVRAGIAHPSPGPDFLFENGDLVVVVGTAEGLSAASEILTGG
jgi:TrkA domain protein